MSKFIEDIEQALGPVFAKHFYANTAPKSFRAYAKQATDMALVRFMRSQFSDSNDAAKAMGCHVTAVSTIVQAMGYSNFKVIPKDEWGAEKLFYKKG